MNSELAGERVARSLFKKGRRMLCNHCTLVLNADLHYQLKDALRTGYQFRICWLIHHFDRIMCSDGLDL